MNYTELKSILDKNGDISGCWLFFGEEDYLKRYSLTAIRKAVLGENTDDVFNHTVFDAQDADFNMSRLISCASALPVFCEKKLIELRGFKITEGMALNSLTEAVNEIGAYDFNVFVVYAEPLEFDGGTEKKRSKVYKALEKCMTPVEFARESPQRLKSWLQKHFRAQGIFADAELCARVVDISGRDMFILTSEAKKLSAYIISHGRDKLVSSDIELVTSKNTEVGAFDFTNALLDGNTASAYSILAHMKNNREEPIAILGSISKVYTNLYLVKTLVSAGTSAKGIASAMKIHEYTATLYSRIVSKCTDEMLDRAIKACYDTDVKLKSLPANGYLIIDRLVAQLSALRVSSGR